MRYAGIIKNDFSAGPGTCVTFFTQGCPHCCEGCHNQETWDFTGGKEFTPEVLQSICDAIEANGVKRNFCVMGGEPLCQENLFLTYLVVDSIKKKFPDIKIYLWTGYYLNDLDRTNRMNQLLEKIDCIIDGPYIEEERDITLLMRGSKNQRILYNGKDY